MENQQKMAQLPLNETPKKEWKKPEMTELQIQNFKADNVPDALSMGSSS